MAVTGTGYAYPSSTNPYVPSDNYSSEITANLVIGYSRDIKKFRINQYTKIIPVGRPQGYYTRISIGQQARLQYPDLRDWLWNPGQDAPRGNWNQDGFQQFPFNAKRYTYSSTLDQLTVDVASFQLETIDVAKNAQLAMTTRTQGGVGVMNNSANWYSTHVSTATTLAGGLWSAGSATNPYIQTSMYKMAIQIQLDTLSVVTPEMLSVVFNPNTARAIGTSQEFRSFLSNQVDAIKFLRGELPTPQAMYNIPEKVYGFPAHVEDTVVNRGKPTANDDFTNNSFLMPDGNVNMLGRPGDLIGSEGTDDYSTVQFFMYEEMSTESFADPKNRNILNRVTEMWDVQVVAPASGYLLTGCI